uniref:Uncharacterized protein n=1 Tax=Mantoniella antarctica TaxID=81844 RepID=A0A7S0T3W0_9CHLO|mmetsp:Transcript_8251/g.20460  ORF Transcript_8251/g.20460 Transcript_8251/m.20460 type:complete len:626 (+) Transcript_8251:237-2114(+)|eukprot:CAMPEP_0181354556 /NCGR_PEP_ID=MMETSP1106-20121128/3421_1 /TAXON_ID=81844 /ORGANISM="Mantoniella antarctica, Strain SL-175" /LENGTH=625 /DNA_ID=CAMNT_0023467221 /DNA_START=237 /DNA_END=2117 /DNA_ORIENTATION=+
MAGDEKRKPDESGGITDDQPRKKRRWDAGEAVAAAAADDPPTATAAVAIEKKPVLPALGALARAKAVLQKQKELAAKLKNIPKLNTSGGGGAAAAATVAAGVGAGYAAAQSAGAAAGAAGVSQTVADQKQQAVQRALDIAAQIRSNSFAAATPKFTPGALRLNARGEEVDAQGNVVKHKFVEVSTFKVNAKQQKLEEFAAHEKEAAAELAGGDREESWMDPRMSKGAKKRDRRGGFQFVQEGRFQKQADMVRLQYKFGEAEARKITAREAREVRAAAEREQLEADADPNLIPLGARAGIKGGREGESAARAAAVAVLDSIPDVEWWDAHLLINGTYDDIADGSWNVKPEKINLYVEHPVPMEPPMEAPEPPPQPLKLTKKEQKKLRTQRRLAREQEKQEMIKQGLLEAPKPKVKISNLMRVLTDEATADPTAVEKEVREQMAERSMAHDDRNEARKLTPAEKREKKLRKLFDDPSTSAETQVHVYRVESMANPKNKFRVDINAQENKLTGVCLITESFSIVIVEGGLKSVRRYEKLMMRRIDWNIKLDAAAAEDQHEDEEEDGAENKCTCVWKGTSPKMAFKKFRFETLRTEAAARKLLADMNLAHFFDAAAACVAIQDDFLDDD